MCPNPVVANGTHSERKIYIRSVLPNDCNCANVVLAQMGGVEAGSPKFTQMLDQVNTTTQKLVSQIHAQMPVKQAAKRLKLSCKNVMKF